ncbi:ASCH domain-containing protein [Bifidobacterium subtile]|nr:ASCH domain-containing protein [Bifidobacterium subtile]QOL37626.1 ASCH domain-containing protein [Bifidobacterium subtile]
MTLAKRRKQLSQTVQAVAARARIALGTIDVDALPRDEFAYPGPLRDKLIASILDGSKTTTTSLLAEYLKDGDQLSPVGALSVPIDSQGKPVCVLRQEEPYTCRLADVTLEHAINEGEEYRTVAQWRKAHEAFWSSPEFIVELDDPDFRLDDDTVVVCERFELIQRL